MKPFVWRLLRSLLPAFALAATAAVAADMPPLPQGLSAPAAATKLPAFNLPTASGGTVRSDDFKGKVIIARFWASW